MIVIRYEKTTVGELKPGDLFATAENHGANFGSELEVADIIPPDGALAFGMYHIRTEVPVPYDQRHVRVYRIKLKKE
jgi:hypothetical protein